MKFIRQLDEMDCGPASLKMISGWHGRHISLQKLREYCHVSRIGVSMEGICDAAEKIGFRTIVVKIRFFRTGEKAGLIEFPLPCIAYWEQSPGVNLKEHSLWPLLYPR